MSKTPFMMAKFAYNRKIPQHMHGAIERYINHGILPGGFLTAVLENDLVGAVSRADHINKSMIPTYLEFFYRDIPSTCWGSVENVKTWVAHKGLENYSA